MQATGLFVVKDWIFHRKLVVYVMKRLHKHGEPATWTKNKSIQLNEKQILCCQRRIMVLLKRAKSLLYRQRPIGTVGGA